jgi:hypothetical protein
MSWKANEKPCRRVGAAAHERSPQWPSWPQWQPTSRLGSCRDSRAHLVPNLQKAPIGKCAHESGRGAPALERFAPVEAGGVERFAPGGGAIRPTRQLAHRLKLESRTNREVRARTDTRAWTNLPREEPLPRTLARRCQVLWAAFRTALVLASPAQKHHRAEHRAMPCPA